jgi:hypothetical protein
MAISTTSGPSATKVTTDNSETAADAKPNRASQRPCHPDRNAAIDAAPSSESNPMQGPNSRRAGHDGLARQRPHHDGAEQQERRGQAPARQAPRRLRGPVHGSATDRHRHHTCKHGQARRRARLAQRQHLGDPLVVGKVGLHISDPVPRPGKDFAGCNVGHHRTNQKQHDEPEPAPHPHPESLGPHRRRHGSSPPIRESELLPDSTTPQSDFEPLNALVQRTSRRTIWRTTLSRRSTEDPPSTSLRAPGRCDPGSTSSSAMALAAGGYGRGSGVVVRLRAVATEGNLIARSGSRQPRAAISAIERSGIEPEREPSH